MKRGVYKAARGAGFSVSQAVFLSNTLDIPKSQGSVVYEERKVSGGVDVTEVVIMTLLATSVLWTLFSIGKWIGSLM